MDNDKFLDYIALGERIRQVRLSTGYSQAVVSEKVGLSESFYGHIERGDRKLSVESLLKISLFLNVSTDYLMMDSEPCGNHDKKLQTELDNIFRDKTREQQELLLKLLKVLSANIHEIGCNN